MGEERTGGEGKGGEAEGKGGERREERGRRGGGEGKREGNAPQCRFLDPPLLEPSASLILLCTNPLSTETRIVVSTIASHRRKKICG